MIANFVNLLFNLAFWAVLIWVILSWVQTTPDHPLRRVQTFLNGIILPVLRPIQRIVPPLRLGAGAIDLSPIILILLIRLLQRPVVSILSGI